MELGATSEEEVKGETGDEKDEKAVRKNPLYCSHYSYALTLTVHTYFPISFSFEQYILRESVTGLYSDMTCLKYSILENDCNFPQNNVHMGR